jgi:EAL domain-containing protein (putative c-di-GMP-specific phosphodiesterase class I)
MKDTNESIAITVNNVASVKTLYGQHQLERSMEIFGKRMTQHFPNYTVFYFGHGDFLLLSRGQAVQDRKALIRELKVRFERTWTSPESEVPLSVSSMILTYGLIPKEITRALDFITYIFSRTYIENKRGNFVVYERIASEFDRGKLVESALSRALQEQRIEVYFQPIYSVREGRIIAAEALARLNDPQLGFVPPDEFIRVAERTGDIMEVGKQVVSQVCAFIAKEHPEQKGVHRISINLSPAQCMNDQLAAELSDIVESYGVPFSMISFEITESSIEDHYLIRKQMLTLKDRGANFSLDDFGTGTSNLVRLLDLPIGIVKFDRNLVNAYFSGKAKFLPDLVRMFQQAQMRIVTEGVETMEMLASLARIGCDFIQGYFFSKPVPYDQFMQYLNSGHAEKVAEELKSSTESRLIGKGAANL